MIERLLDFAAKQLGIDRAEIRRKNLLRPDQFPFNNEILFQDSAPLTYDSGDYEPALDEALKAIDYAGFVREEQPRLKASRSEEHTSELQSRLHLVCRLLLEKKKIK